MSRQEFTTVSFVKGVIGEDTLLESRPIVVFAGRSNVGKSSTINAVLEKNVARKSSTPGKTQEINIYDVDTRFFVADLPGYGYAQVKGNMKEKFRKRILWFLSEKSYPIKVIVLVLDAKAGLTELDRDLLFVASGEGIPVILGVNKIDKLNQKETSTLLREIAGVEEEFPVVKEVVAISALKMKGIQKLREKVQEML